ncbi:MAG: MscL family protein [Nanoarchaeota archaeon]|nr:MscL family protein [Nanoarchaeota archaeon]MBU0963203.1 MscL family protein [Nanoarchaeota archaeon]
MAVLKDFKDFLKEYRIIGISIGFIVAIAASNFIQSFVNDVFLPILRPLISNTSIKWEEIILPIGSINIRLGSFLSTSFNLIIILLVLYLFIAKILKWKPKK